MDNDTAKAAQEIAKTTAKALDVTAKVGSFLNKVVGGTAVELGATLQDWASFYRYKNLLRLQDRVEEIHRERRLQGKTIPVPPRYAIPLLQAASLEDEESIQNMWAGLIANSTDPNARLEPKKIYIEILSSLEPFDARVLKYLSSRGWLLHRNVPDGGITIADIQAALGSVEEDLRLSLQNLHRLGCIIDEFDPTWDQIGTTSFGQRITDPKTTFRTSPLGLSLLKACDVGIP